MEPLATWCASAAAGAGRGVSAGHRHRAVAFWCAARCVAGDIGAGLAGLKKLVIGK